MKKQVLDKLIARELTRIQAANLMQMHPNAVSRLKKQYIKYGSDVLIPGKPCPKNGEAHNRTPDWIEKIVTEYAIKRPSLGPIPLSEEISDKYGINLDQATIWRILRRKKIRYTKKYKRWKQEKPKLYCLNTPGLELQMDACFPFGRSRKIASFDAIDDCSRYICQTI